MRKLDSILVIDNDPVSNFVSEKILSYLGISDNVISFLGGEEALDFLSKECLLNKLPFPELIMLDIDMPCMDGFQFITALKKMNISNKIDIVILSTSVYNKNIDKAKAKGIKYYIAKPLDVSKMQEICQCIYEDKANEFVFIH